MNRQLVSVTDAVPYQEFAKLIGKTPRAVRGMIEKGKLPVIEITDPQSVSGRAGEYWVYLPAWNIRVDLAQNGIRPQRWELEALARGATVNYDGKKFTYPVADEWPGFSTVMEWT